MSYSNTLPVYNHCRIDLVISLPSIHPPPIPIYRKGSGRELNFKTGNQHNQLTTVCEGIGKTREKGRD